MWKVFFKLTNIIIGEFITTSERFRSQLQNKNDCFVKLYELIVLAAWLPERPTKIQTDKIHELYPI